MLFPILIIIFCCWLMWVKGGMIGTFLILLSVLTLLSILTVSAELLFLTTAIALVGFLILCFVSAKNNDTFEDVKQANKQQKKYEDTFGIIEEYDKKD